jgi:hypothetical protein
MAVGIAALDRLEQRVDVRLLPAWIATYRE